MKARLLIVDDETEIRILLRRHFSYLGYTVETAAGGEGALAQLAKDPADIVISDISMPGMDGVELLETVRRESPVTRFIMMTGYVTHGNILACMRAGAEVCVFKPLEDLTVLEQAVANAERAINDWLNVLSGLEDLKKNVEVPSGV